MSKWVGVELWDITSANGAMTVSSVMITALGTNLFSRCSNLHLSSDAVFR
jgi:hypothetical protein